VLLTAGLWLLTIPFYPKRCITCGLTKSDRVPWYRTWRLGFVLTFAIVLSGAVVYKFFPSSTAKASNVGLLGFQRDTHDAGVHAASIGFRLKGCEDKGDEFRYCNYVRQPDETLLVILWRDELETIEYDFGIKRYNGLRNDLLAKYGSQRTVYEPHDPSSKLSDEWASIPEGETVSLIERADHKGGSATLHFSGGKLDEYMRSAYPGPQNPPDAGAT